MKKTIVIIICALVVLGVVAAGLILFLPRNETIHIEDSFIKTNITNAEVQGDTPEGTKLNTVIDITVTVNNAGLCSASGTVKLGEQTFDINDVTVSADGYTLSRKDNGSTVAALYWHRDDEKNTSLMINSDDYYGNWWYSKD